MSLNGGLMFSFLLLLHEDLVVQKLELDRVQFGFRQHRRGLLAERNLSEVFIRLTGDVTGFIFGQFEVHTQPDSGAGAGAPLPGQGPRL